MNFTYYTLSNACGTNETGKIFPQIQKMRQGYNYDSDDSIYALSKYLDQFPIIEPNLDYFVLNNKAKLSDFLSTSLIGSNGFLISDKVKNLFSRFNLMRHRYYPAYVCFRKNVYNYYWVHFIPDLIEKVDFENSSFVILQNYSHKVGNINVSSLEDLIQKKERLKLNNPKKTITIWADKIHLLPNFTKHLDLFKIGVFDTSFYISESLKNSLISNKITGCQISPASNILFAS